jgi:anti-sigma regulatory factor (Ser/Thr protein kinase)
MSPVVGTPQPMAFGESLLDLPAVPNAAAMARSFVRRLWSSLESADTLDGVVLCVSELVTNALDHATPPYQLRVGRRKGWLRIEVTDASDREPILRPLSPSAGRGRGIFLVQTIATKWGVEPSPTGKTVWAEFASSV